MQINRIIDIKFRFCKIHSLVASLYTFETGIILNQYRRKDLMKLWAAPAILFHVCLLIFPAQTLVSSEDQDLYTPFSSHLKNLSDMQPDELASASIPMANLEGEPSAFVNGCVNAITGDFNEFQVDLEIPGVDSLTLERSFSGSTKHEGSLCAGWNLNLFGYLEPWISRESGEKCFYAVVSEGHGATNIFEKSLKNEKTIDDVHLSSQVLKKGVTNTASGYVSGQTNIKNLKVYEIDETTFHVRNGSGGYRAYKRYHKSDSKFELRNEFKPTGNIIHYQYYHNKRTKNIGEEVQDDLWMVELLSPDKKKIGSLKYVRNERSDFKKFPHQDVIASDGRKVCYHFEMNSKHDKRLDCLLTKVERSDAPTVSYEYIKGTEEVGQLIRRKSLPDDRFIKVHYFKKGDNLFGSEVVKISHKSDPRVNRVRALRAPVGVDAKPLITHRFYYQFKVDKKGSIPEPLLGGITTVYDAYENKTLYKYDDNHRLRALEKCDEDGNIYSRERLYWGKNNSKHSTYLLSRSLGSDTGPLVFARSYLYDDAGNVLRDCLYGNFSGSNLISPVISDAGEIVENDCECFRKQYTYSTDGWNLLMWEGDPTQEINYRYVPGTNLLREKFTGDYKTIYRREFYEYNPDTTLSKEIIDDGISLNQNDLSGITERHLTYYQQRQSNSFNLPGIVIEKCLDLSTGKEVLIHKVVNSYVSPGRLCRQEHYDNTDTFAYVLSWEYDAMGNVTKEVDPIGRVTSRRFDANGNCIYEQGPNFDCHKEFAYDFMNRLIREEEVHSDGIRRCVSHRYNLLGQRIASIDSNGNKTRYHYDAFGRVTKIIYPTVFDEFMTPIQPTVSKSYDLMGNVVSAVDARSNEKKMSYTIRGQLAGVAYPDGSEEKNVYRKNGSLKYAYAKNGTRTYFAYDAQGRAIKTKVLSSSDKLLATTSATYSSFHVLSETDFTGQITQYTYYPDGKLKSKQRGDSLSWFIYDSLGRLYKSFEQYGPLSEEVVVKVQEYDLLDRVVEERIEDYAGNALTRVSYSYDIAGNVSEVKSGEGSVSTTIYDSHGTPVLAIDADGNKTVTTCRYDFVNELGQFVAYKETTDPLGNLTAITADALGRIVSVVRKNPMGVLTQKQEVFYNANGNRGRLIDAILSPNGNERQVVTILTYDACDRLVETCEAVGTPEQTRVAIGYNSFGQKCSHIKTDGSILHHTYDALGRLASLHSSDGTIHYVYRYDLNSNPIQVDDLINKTTTIKRYDDNGRLIRETLGNGLALRYSYDKMGRSTQVTLPDSSGIAYSYGPCFLETVKRLNVDGTVAYEHRYEKFDLGGHVTDIQLIGNAGSLRHQYDQLGRLRNATSSHWSESITTIDAVGNLLEKQINDSLGIATVKYAYDDLYQLKSEDGLISHTYQHDSHYNRVDKDGDSHSHNALNQLLNDGKSTYTYDLNGNLIQKMTSAGTIAYGYDALNRLVLFTDDSQQVRYSYDENNRRLSKAVYSRGSSDEWTLQATTRYLYQGQNEIGAVDSKNNIFELRVLGIGKGAEIGAAIALELENQVYVPIHDHAGHVACLLENATGEVVETYRYTAFGEELFDSAISPWRFASKRTDPETGLVNFGRRYYDPDIGRWITQDPLGREGGPNLYAYVLNSPLMLIDMYGLFGFSNEFKSRWSNSWNAFSSDVGRFATNLIKAPGWAIQKLAFNLIPIPGVKDVVECIGWTLQGNSPSSFVPGWRQPRSQRYIHHGYGNTDPHHRYVLYNGMCNDFDEHKAACAKYSEENGGVDVHGIYNSEDGLTSDLLEVGCQKIGIPTNAQIVAERETRNILDEMGEYRDNATLFVKAHSQGCETVHNLSPDLKRVMDVKAYGPARILQITEYKRVQNIIGSCDFITPLADPLNFWGCFFCGTLTLIPTIGSPLECHLLDGPTYSRMAQIHGHGTKLKYGSVECF